MARASHGLLIAATALLAATSACGKKEKKDERKVTVKASSLALTPSETALRLLAGPEAPDYTGNEYDGMGVLSSEAVVEGFKIKLTTVMFGSGMGKSSELSFPEEELEIADGVNSSVSVTGKLDEGKWDRVSVGFKPWYKLKAYAYMDSNNDGTIDTTVFTTPDEVKKAAARLSKAEMEGQGYGEFEYGFTYVHCSDSATASTKGNCGTISVFTEPFDTAAMAEDAEVTVNLLIDSTKVVTAWTGGTGTYQFKGDVPTADILGDTTKVPNPKNFPLSDTCSDTKNDWGLNSCDFFPLDKPAFRLQYLPAFAFLDTTDLSSRVFAVSKEDGSWNHYNSGTIQIVFKGDAPQLGLAFTDPSGDYDYDKSPVALKTSTGPVLGSVARIFEKDGDTYTFYMDGSNKDADGNDDGGLYYNNDKSMAGYIVEGFDASLAVDGVSTITVKDGPRCKGEYDNCIGDRTYYVKRIK